ncbi:MAG TPA: thiamine pyrophosphate-dependent enzyme [Myxococcaceae bacterium]|nr:thiamine pyrophosphate-dependent enzyme [Myxococcaceae bacterium]
MGMVTGGQLVARMLKRENVRHVFTLSGLHIAPIYAGCVEEGIEVIDTRHEQAAGNAADAYARITRGVGVAVVTAVANANAANAPLLVLAGAAPIFNQSKGSLQEMEQVDLFHRIAKWSDRVPTPELVPLYMAKAFRVALSGRPGPVFLELAWDVLCNAVEEMPLPTGYRSRAGTCADPEKVDEAMALLQQAERPAIIAGSSIWWDGAWEQLRHFAETAQIPVYLNGAGRGCLPPDHPLFFQHTRKEVLSGADLVFVIGTPFDFRLNYGQEPTFGAQSRIVQVDIDPVELGRNRSVDVGLISDSFSALKAFAESCPRIRRDAYLSAIRENEKRRLRDLEEWTRDDSKPIHHYRLARELSEVARAHGDPVFVADGGNWVAMAAKVIAIDRPGRWLDPGPLGCLGVGAPFAIASKLLHPERAVWVVQGDGAFGLNGMDFETALRFKLPMVCVVGNDAAWGQIRIPQVQMFGEDKSPATLLAPTRYDRIVEALGGRGELVTEPGQIRPALERAVMSGTVACVNVMLDPEAPVKAGAMGYAV